MDLEIIKLGKRNLTVAFREPFYTTTHLIFGDHRVYVCDTFIGPDSMKEITKIIEKHGHGNKQIVVFNSHADWDHVWGNCYFKDALILGHRECRARIEKEGENDLKRNFGQQQGKVILTPPTTVFDKNYLFDDDQVEFFHSPGHTIDSASCYDHKDRILFVGDNVESDIPYVNSLDFDTYITTLEEYLKRDWQNLVPGHDPVQTDDKLLRSNIEYLKLLKEWKINLDSMSQRALHVHLYTLSKLVDEIIKEGISTAVESHYRDAIIVLKKMEATEKTATYLEQFRRIAE